jgi:hypothetical protein
MAEARHCAERVSPRSKGVGMEAKGL